MVPGRPVGPHAATVLAPLAGSSAHPSSGPLPLCARGSSERRADRQLTLRIDERRDTERAVSQENVEIVRSAFAAWGGGDRERALDLADPEIVVDATRRVFNPATYVGVEGVRRMFADMDEVWQEFSPEQLEFIDAGDRVVVIGRSIGKGKSSGVKVERPLAAIWTVRDGRVIRVETSYVDRRAALEAVGLAE
jgi:ketosteroid isomerase-like protein